MEIAGIMNPGNANFKNNKFTEQRVNSIFNVMHIPNNLTTLKGNGIYSLPEQGAKIDPRAISNFGWKLLKNSDGSQVLTGMIVKRSEKTVSVAGPAEANTPYIVAHGEENYDVDANGVISIYKEPSSVMFVTNMIFDINSLKVDDELTCIDGYLFPKKLMTAELYNAAMGTTLATDAEAIAATKSYFRVVNENHQNTLFQTKTNVVGEVHKRPRMALIESIKY